MLIETKAKVGVFSIALQAYLPQFPELVPEFEEQYATFKKTLPETVELIDGGLVTTKEQAQADAAKTEETQPEEQTERKEYGFIAVSCGTRSERASRSSKPTETALP